jgi:glycosyltransferase involved in cell wall biosynthesis
MKILFVLPSYEPAWAYGGVVRCTSILCRELIRNGNQVTVYTMNTSGTNIPLDVLLNQSVNTGGVQVYYFLPSFNSKSSFHSQSLIKKLRETISQFDIVYGSAIWQWLGIATAAICHKHKIPLVIGIHGSFDKALTKHGLLKKTLFRILFLDRALNHSSAIHLTTKTERIESLDWLNKRRSFIVPNPVDENQFYALPESRTHFRQKYHIPEHTNVVITVGRPDWKKRVDLLIHSLAKNPDWYLLVVGDDKQDKALEWKAIAKQLNVQERIVWTGYLTGDDLLRAYSAADIFALISQSENFGMVVVEAMLANLPILVSEQVGVWEMLRDKNVGVSTPLDISAISKVMADFEQNSDLWQAKAKNARFVAISEFAATKVATLMQDAFADVISGHRSSQLDWM